MQILRNRWHHLVRTCIYLKIKNSPNNLKTPKKSFKPLLVEPDLLKKCNAYSLQLYLYCLWPLFQTARPLVFANSLTVTKIKIVWNFFNRVHFRHRGWNQRRKVCPGELIITMVHFYFVLSALLRNFFLLFE